MPVIFCRIPDHEHDREVVRAGAANVDDLLAGRGVAGDRVVAGQKARELLGAGRGVAVHQAGGERLVHRLHEGIGFRQAERADIAGEDRFLAVDFAEAFQHGCAFVELADVRLGTRHTFVERAERNARKAGTNRRAVAGRKVALRPGNVVENRVLLVQELRDASDLAVRIETLCDIDEGDDAVAENCHLPTPCSGCRRRVQRRSLA
jgi:hypothetical protein